MRSQKKSNEPESWARVGGTVGGCAGIAASITIYGFDSSDGAQSMLRWGLIAGLCAAMGSGIFWGLAYAFYQRWRKRKIIGLTTAILLSVVGLILVREFL